MSSFLPPVSESEKEGIEKIRHIFRDELPRDLDTDFNLRRWINGWKGDLKQIEPRLRNYIRNRKLFKLDAEDLLDQPLHPILAGAFKHLAISVRVPPPVNPIDNTVVVIYRLEHVDVVGFAKIFTPSEYMFFNFAMSEIMLRHILRQEAISGKPSGCTLLYDMHGVHFGDFVNPSAPHMKLATLAMTLQQDNYCDMMHQVVCIRVPAFMNIVWEISKKFLNEATLKKFIMYTEHKYPQHIFDHIHPSTVPTFYGGNWREDGPIDPTFQELQIDAEKCCSVPQPVPDSKHAKPSWTPKEWTVHYIRPKHTFTVVKSVQNREPLQTVLRWQFETNANVEFAIYYEKAGADRQPASPKLTLCTPNIPEEKHLLCRDYGPGDYIFEFSNFSTSWFSLKLHYCIEEIEE